MIEALLARWFLLTRVRLEKDKFKITRDFLPNLLGARREAVSNIARSFRQKEIISYNRNSVLIVSQADLKAVCQSYQIIRDEEENFSVKLKTSK